MSLAPSIGRRNGAQPIRERMAATSRYGLTVAMAALTGLFALLYLNSALYWQGTPFIGALVSHTLVITNAQPQSDAAWPALTAGLQARDQIVALDGRALPQDYGTALEIYEDILLNKAVGETLTLTAVRPATGERLEATVTLINFPLADFLVYFLIPFVSGIITLAASALLLALRPRSPGALIGVATGLTLSLFMIGLFDLSTNHEYMPVWMLATALLGGCAIHLGLVFPSRMIIVYRQPAVRFVPLGVSLGVAALAILNHFAPATPQGYFLSNQLVVVYALGGIGLLTGCMVIQRRSATSLITRDQSGTLLIGMLLAAAPGIVWLIGQVLQAVNSGFVFQINIEASTPFYLMPVASLLYAFIQYHRFDTDRFFSQSVTYLILLVALVAGYFLLITGASFMLLDRAGNNPFYVAVTLFVVAVLFLPIRNRLQNRIDQIYFRQRINYQERLEEYGQELSSLEGYSAIIQEFRRLATEAILPAHIYVFLPRGQGEEFVAFGDLVPETSVEFAADSGVAALLRRSDGAVYLRPGAPWPGDLLVDRARLAILQPLVLVGLSGSGGDRLGGFVVVGPPRSGRGAYGYEEIRFLNAMVAQLTVAIERAQVIVSLERRVRELDVLSNVGQAVNFVIQFDDLLELISAQAAKLVDAEFFYIALYVEGVNEMYFAFFLERDERYSEFENKRWPMGGDLFSSVVHSSQPVRLDDYGKLLANGTYERVQESDKIKALMAVPLIAQTRTMGVLAVGKSRMGENYTGEQLKIFGDIAALAATSIEKARLFDELNVRARQLATLNEISQKLVAAEGGDVDELLVLITQSGVQLLSAEAGSLLLADDDDQYMEFKVVIGGTSTDLVGKRLDPNHGLVGEVVRSGQFQIVNDVRRDERWEGEITKSGFRTQSILAVPLIAKDRTIGVLEILNKLDGTAFDKADAELLTTLAGQAAIAIENARLFQGRGTALAQRVQELQTLEQIDRELARTLNITRVAEVTVKWAVVNSGAVAAALGEVDETQEWLRIHHLYGYRPEEYPEGAEGRRWPLDRGIVKRVMRTRTPELAITSIDPDYEPTLAGSLSQITVPMISGDEIIAILILETNKEPRFNLIDLEFVKRLAERASIALANAQLYEGIMRAAETKSEFIGFAAHELKNPLTVIKGYSNVLLGAMGDAMSEEMRKSNLSIIRSNADRMQTIIDDLRDIAASDAGKLTISQKPVRIHDVVSETLVSFEQQMRDKEQTIYNDLPLDLPEIIGDHKKLVQVMVNLVSNAHKYTPEGGEIHISAEVNRNYRDARGRLTLPMLHVKVRDTGIGMSEDDLKRIFREDYFRSEDSRAQEQKGTGLGMMITQRIVQQHGGRIWVESQLNEGSTFQFVIPVPPDVLVQDQATGNVTINMTQPLASHKAPTMSNGREAREKLQEMKDASTETRPSRAPSEQGEPASD